MPHNTPPVSPPPLKKAHAGVIWILGFCAFLNVYSVQSVLPLLSKEFVASPAALGATVGLTVLAVALVSPFIGMLSDKKGRKPIICLSLFGLSLPAMLMPFAVKLEYIMLLRFIQGLFIPGVIVVLLAYIAEEFSGKEITLMTSVYVGGTVIGGFCGRFITGYAGHYLGWRGAFAILAVLNLLGALIALIALPASQRFIAHQNGHSARYMLQKHLKTPALIGACAVGFCVLFSLVGAFTYINLHLSHPPFHLTSVDLGNIFAVYLIGGFISPSLGKYITRLGSMRSLLMALSLSAIGMLMTLAPTVPVILVGLTFGSMGVFICQSSTISFIADHVQEGRSLATGLYYMSYYAGGAASTLLCGIAYEAFGWVGCIATVVCAQIIAGGLALYGWRPRPVVSPLKD